MGNEYKFILEHTISPNFYMKKARIPMKPFWNLRCGMRLQKFWFKAIHMGHSDHSRRHCLRSSKLQFCFCAFFSFRSTNPCSGTHNLLFLPLRFHKSRLRSRLGSSKSSIVWHWLEKKKNIFVNNVIIRRAIPRVNSFRSETVFHPQSSLIVTNSNSEHPRL